MIITNALLKPIYSFNLGGKIKYAGTDLADKFNDALQKKKNAGKSKFQKIKDYVQDNLNEQQAQEFLRSKGFPRMKVGKCIKVNSIDGATFKVLAGNPENKNYYGFFLHRNGNDIRILKQDEFSEGEHEDKKKSVLNWYNTPDVEFEDDSMDPYDSEIFDENQNSEDDSVHPDEFDERAYWEDKMREYWERTHPNDPYDENGNIRQGDDFEIREGDIVLDKGDYVIEDDGDEYVIHEKDSGEFETNDSDVDYGEWNY